MPSTELQIPDLESQILNQEREVYESSLRFFVPDFWPCLEPGKRLDWGWHLDAICDHLDAVRFGHIKDLVINIPPRHLKSMTTSVFFPCQWWATEPWVKFLMISYGKGLVLRDNNKARRLIHHAKYQKYWGHKYQLTADQNVKSFYETTMGGARMIGSIESGVTGEGGDVIIIDDPLELKNAENKNALDRCIQVWDEELESRLNDPVTGRRVLIMQRLNARDLTGHVLREGGWVHLYLPTRYEDRRRCITFLNGDVFREGDTNERGELVVRDEAKPDSMPFFVDPRKTEGELLFPSRFPKRSVDKLEKKGPLIFAGQQQQNPAVTGGTIFKRSWFENTYYDALPPLMFAQMRGCCLSFDCAFKKLEDSAFVAGLAMVQWETDIFVLPKHIHDRLSFTETLQGIKFLAETYPAIGAKLIEDKANGTAAIEVLTRQIRGIIPVEVKNDSKEGRAQAVAYLPQAGNVRLPNPKIWPWVAEFVNELTSFPRGTYKDYVDAFTQGLYYFETLHSGELGEDAASMLSEGREENVREWRKVF